MTTSRPLSGVALTIAAVVGVCATVAAIVWLPSTIVGADLPPTLPKGTLTLTEAERLGAISAVRQHILWAVGGLIAIVTLIFTWRRDQTARFVANLDRDANFTTRYTEAITQLGSEEPTIRLGGIYALERIATDSQRDHSAIIDVLAAFVRANSPVATTSKNPLSQEIAAAVTVIGRISRLHGGGPRLNLAHCYLAGAELKNAHLRAADLTGADLTFANLRGAFLDDANISDAMMNHVDLENSSMRNVNAVDTYLNFANLGGAHLRGARLIATQLERAQLAEADLTRADMTDAHLIGADLSGADLSYANLLHVEGPGVDLSAALLTEALNRSTPG